MKRMSLDGRAPITLLKQYALLLRRGMPPHPRLRTKQGAFIFSDSSSDSLAVTVSDILYPDDVRAVLAMHALKWFAHVAMNGAEEGLRQQVFVQASTGYAGDILDAIIAATAYMDGDTND
jgi:hypothetical protein